MSYKKLQIWQLSQEIVIEIHSMTLNHLPKFELFETGNQLRRSVQSIKSNIVEGYGRRCYKNDFIHFLIIARASTLEAIDQLESLYETKSLKDKKMYEEIRDKLDKLSRQLYLFIQQVKKPHDPNRA
jgi:four helix bundle protein